MEQIKKNFLNAGIVYAAVSWIIIFSVTMSSGAVTAAAYYVPELVPVGKAVGISVSIEGASVVSVSETSGGTFPAREAGIQPGDVIISINSKAVRSTDDIKGMAGDYNGDPLRIVFMRKGKETTVILKPYHNPGGGYELGLWLRDSMSGLGTVTFYDPVSGIFGALGHGVNDADSGALIRVKDGSINFTEISETVPGKPGFPGQLRGKIVVGNTDGTIIQNTDTGIFGKLLCGEKISNLKSVPVANDGEIKVGSATILCDVGDGTKEFKVEISRLYLGAGIESKNMLITVTDEALIEKTGGIVQGMSGSPILQNGKLVGAVTHVLINNPQKGYGITIQNMMAAVKYSEKEKAA